MLHWEFNHFVVLKRATRTTYTIHDPAVGVRVLRAKEFSQRFTGIAVDFSPQHNFRPEKVNDRVTLSQLSGRVRGLSKSLAGIFGIAIALEIFVLAAPFLVQLVVDGVITTGDISFLSVVCISFIFLLIVQALIAYARSWAVIRVGAELNEKWLGNVFSHVLRLPMPFFERRYVGDIVSRFKSTTTIQRALTNDLIEALLDGMLVLVSCSVMLAYSFKLTTVSFAAIVLYGALRLALFRRLKEAAAEHLVQLVKHESHFYETVRGMQAIKTCCGQNERRSRWQVILQDTLHSDLRLRMLQAFSKVSSQFLSNVERVVIIWLGALMVLEATLTLGMLLAFLSFRELFSSRIVSFIDRSVELNLLRLEADRLSDLVTAEPESDGHFGYRPLLDSGAPPPRLELRNVFFRFSADEPWLLEDVNLTVESGEYVAITGPSGGGKSTLVRVLLGLLVPTSGDVLVDNVSLSKIGPSAFRSLVGAVMQDDVLFGGSLAENISFFDSDARPEDIENAASLAAIHDVIDKFPMRYETTAGDMGVALSGGQRQRLFLARALYRKPKILLLDEATSHLDMANERRVNDSVSKLRITRIVVAHRRETLESAERVFKLEGGKLSKVTL